MKFSIFSFSILLLLLFSFKNEQPDKVALIVGISEYTSNSGWPTINGENDIPIIRNALLARGFQEKNIHIIKGKKATKENIINQLGLLSNQVAEGGFFIFHFSGHGQQVIDVKASKDEIDGYDEALVPYDAHSEFKVGIYDGKNHLVDDELNEYITKIRRKIGIEGQLLVMVDACHSGTSTRDSEQMIGPQRGTEKKIIFFFYTID